MSTKKLSIFLALFALILAQLACAAGEPSLSNVRTAKDEDGKQATSTFGAFDTVYVVADLSNGVMGNQVSSRWFFDNVPGFESGALIDESTIDITEDSFNGTVYFYFPAQTDGWPVGTYKVEVYFNGTLNSTVNFTVQ
ncbi:MAG: hypothetical protein DCC59_07790 [Chloroflexi bacterium]|nr:hypothetical protein [Anaerolineales bacterium]MCE7918536.1 hypothetical protein [Chloroflexi bacterium CFX1]MCQ3952376.1 hypothetical protein [Chloroflexota bacterium]MDL1918394.1 hypothetical protein [Chloroflexi bacterium CFX5]MCK6567994.1 hypothetical protein [Anaerolineales bacterium]